MANNRLWLVHKPTGEAICLGKRMGVGWYSKGTPDLNAFYERLDGEQQDDFVLLLEDAEDASSTYQGEWIYEQTPDGMKPKLLG